MMESNIFEKANFGDKFISEDNKEYIFVGQHKSRAEYYGLIGKSHCATSWFTPNGNGPYYYSLDEEAFYKDILFPDNIINKYSTNL